jgi:hypothetical protein
MPGLQQKIHQTAIGALDGDRQSAGLTVAGQPADQRGDSGRGNARS